MPVDPQTLTLTLRQAFLDADITVIDTAGDHNHYEVTIASPQFVGKNRVAQHRLVYDALGTQVGNDIHALSLTTHPKGDTP
jgi:stress-induced morphogen